MNWIGKEEIITSTKDWVVPEAKDQLFQITVWGGGGSGSIDGNYYSNIGGAGGGSGEMKFGEFTLEKGKRIHIEIGKGGEGVTADGTITDYIEHIIGKSGGTTSFGEYISANGGLGGYIDQGGKGGFDGGDTGETAEGNYLGYGHSGSVLGYTFSSGGGAAAVNARGIGGTAKRSQGNGGTAAGGAGCFVEQVNSKTISRRIGSGGNGVCVITYYAPIGR